MILSGNVFNSSENVFYSNAMNKGVGYRPVKAPPRGAAFAREHSLRALPLEVGDCLVPLGILLCLGFHLICSIGTDESRENDPIGAQDDDNGAASSGIC